jgi:hypothetical protein
MDENNLFTTPSTEQRTEAAHQPELPESAAELNAKEAALLEVIKNSEEIQEPARSTLERIAAFQENTPPQSAPFSQQASPEQSVADKSPSVTPEESPAAEVLRPEPTSDSPEQREVLSRMDLDPRYTTLANKINSDHLRQSLDILRQQGMSQPQAEFHMATFGSGHRDEKGQVRVNVATPEGIQKTFAEQHPAEYAAYREAEKHVVFESPRQDAAYNELQTALQGIEDTYHGWDSGHEYRGYTSQADIDKHRTETHAAYEEFVAAYPEKAEAYTEFDPKLAEYRKQTSTKPTSETLIKTNHEDIENSVVPASNFSNEPPSSATPNEVVYARQPTAEQSSEMAETTYQSAQQAPLPTDDVGQQSLESKTSEGAAASQIEASPSQAIDSNQESEQPIDRLVMEFKASGVNVEKVSVPGGSGDMLILKKSESVPQDSVRIYRGYNHLDPSILNQAPYAMRALNQDSSSINGIEGIRGHVDALAHEPTYGNLIAYAEAMRPYLSPAADEKMEQEIADIEDNVLSGYSLRTELRMNQVGHAGGVADVGVSPYLSASFNPSESLGYTQGDGSVLVLDIPLSELEGYTGGDEVQIKGGLDQKYITAVIPRKALGNTDQEQQILSNLLKAMPTAPEALSQNAEKLQSAKQRQKEVDSQFDSLHRTADIHAIQHRRYEKLKPLFPDLSFELTSQEMEEPYTATMKKIYSSYQERFTALDGHEPDISEYKYLDRSGLTQQMDEAKLNPEMLLNLKEIIEHREKRRLERQQEQA